MSVLCFYCIELLVDWLIDFVLVLRIGDERDVNKIIIMIIIIHKMHIFSFLTIVHKKREK